MITPTDSRLEPSHPVAGASHHELDQLLPNTGHLPGNVLSRRVRSVQGLPEAGFFRCDCADNGPGRESWPGLLDEVGRRILISHKPRPMGAQPSDGENENGVIDLRDLSWVDRRPGPLARGSRAVYSDVTSAERAPKQIVGGPDVSASMAAGGADEPRSELRVCVVGSGSRFVSGISYYTYFVACALKQRYDVTAILMRHLIPRRWYPGRQRVGHSVMAYDLAAELPTFDGVDWWGWPSVPRAVSFLRSQRPHVLILQWWSASVLPWYLLLARQAVRRGGVVVVELHEDLDTGEARLPLVGWFARRGLKALCRRAAMLIVHSTWDRDRMSASLGISPVQFRVIPHGPYPIFDAVPGEATGSPRARSLRERSELTVLFFGTIRPYKGLEHLIRAFEQLRGDLGVPWKLVVVGETWEGWTLPLELIESSPHRDDIELVNRYVTDQEAAGYFRRADVVALPYLRSSASGPLAIAQACGLPVVVTAVGGLVEAVADYDGAVLVRPDSPDDLARGLLTAADLRDRVYSAPVTWQAVAQLYADMFAAIVPADEPAPMTTRLKPARWIRL